MTLPGYDPKTPLTDDTIADGQPSFLTNFSTLFTAFAQNHVSLNAAANAGNHNVIELVETKPANVPSTEFDEIAVYVKKAAGSTDQIWMRYPLNGKEFQLTEYQIYALDPIKLGNVTIQVPYFSFLPGGVIVYFGKVLATTIPGSATFEISLEPAICRNLMGVNLCPIGGVNANLPQSNVTLKPTPQNQVAAIILNTLAGSNIPDQYYLAFGNINIS